MPYWIKTTMKDVPVGKVIVLNSPWIPAPLPAERMDDDEVDMQTDWRHIEFEDGWVAYRDIASDEILLIPGDAEAWLKVE